MESLGGRLTSKLSISTSAPFTDSPALGGELPNFPELGADGIYHIQTATQHK
jgi:hypothetical protein